MSHLSRIPMLVSLALILVPAAYAQRVDGRVIELSGPRIGVTYLSPGVISRIKRETDISVGSMVTQFGWQTEKRYGTFPNGATPVTELVVLVGGMEQNQFLPSITGLVGLRTPEGMEFGVGPNITPASASLAVAFGMTYRSGALNVPVNVAIVPSDAGVRISLLSGFNLRSR